MSCLVHDWLTVPTQLIAYYHHALPRGTRLAMAGVTLLLVLVASMTIWWLQNSHQSAGQRAAGEADNAARLLEQRVLATNREIDLMLDDIARDAARMPIAPPLEWSEPTGFEAIMMLRHKPERLPHVTVLTILDPQGRVAYSAKANRGDNFSDLPYIRQLIANPSQRLVISQPYALRTTGKMGVVFARPVLNDEGKLHAIVVAGVHLDAWQRHLRDIELGQHGSVILMDTQYRLIAREPLTDRASLGTQVQPSQMRPSGLRDQTYFVVSPLDNERRLSGVRNLAEYPFILGVGLSEQDYLAEWRAALLVCVFGMISLLAFGGWLMYLLWQSGRHAKLLAEREARLAAQESRMRSMVEASPCALGLIDFSHDRIRYVNPDMGMLFGMAAEDMAGKELAELFVRPEEWRACRKALHEATTLRELEYAVRNGDSERWVILSATVLDGDGDSEGDDVLVSLIDVTSRHVRETRLSHEAGTDALTGLANRRRFFERGSETFELARRHRRPFSLLMIDIDHFKQVNDAHGHAVGDEVLVRLARLLEVTLRQGDLAVRLGGEEFVAVLPETNLEHAIEAAERIREAVENAPLTLEDGTLIEFTVSVGAAQMQEDDKELQSLLIAADAALYRAKANGRNRVEADNL
ncbi:diguanylate cyclase [Chitinimonas sp. JJ19]|uniref:diguanylate cyclase n=1 Tax=Chitinimonas sp. JJ19 TaxID=3109352 RepID=UPI00300329A3